MCSGSRWLLVVVVWHRRASQHQTHVVKISHSHDRQVPSEREYHLLVSLGLEYDKLHQKRLAANSQELCGIIRQGAKHKLLLHADSSLR